MHFPLTFRYLPIYTSYQSPPLVEVTLERFEECALNRLRILAEIESSYARNRTWEELKNVTDAQCKKYLNLKPNGAGAGAKEPLVLERENDHLSHFVLRLAFCRS